KRLPQVAVGVEGKDQLVIGVIEIVGRLAIGVGALRQVAVGIVLIAGGVVVGVLVRRVAVVSVEALQGDGALGVDALDGIVHGIEDRLEQVVGRILRADGPVQDVLEIPGDLVPRVEGLGHVADDIEERLLGSAIGGNVLDDAVVGIVDR